MALRGETCGLPAWQVGRPCHHCVLYTCDRARGDCVGRGSPDPARALTEGLPAHSVAWGDLRSTGVAGRETLPQHACCERESHKPVLGVGRQTRPSIDRRSPGVALLGAVDGGFSRALACWWQVGRPCHNMPADRISLPWRPCESEGGAGERRLPIYHDPDGLSFSASECAVATPSRNDLSTCGAFPPVANQAFRTFSSPV